jgi:triacylglycerol lipase
MAGVQTLSIEISMLARLQRFLILAGIGLTLVWLLICVKSDQPRWDVIGTASSLVAYVLVLGFEFLCLWYAGRVDRTVPTPSAKQVLRAWLGETCAAPLVFGWRQPFPSQRWPDQLPDNARDKRGLLLVHGFFCNRGLWNAWMARLTAEGVPFIAVDLEPLFGSIDDYAKLIDKAVTQLRRCTGKAPVIVARSMGGLAVRHWWSRQTDRGCVHRLITLGTPHHGTWLARFAFTRNVAQMRQQSLWLQSLTEAETPLDSTNVTCFYSHCDNIVFPPSTATLLGANNIHVPGVAHVQMVDQPLPWQENARWLAS